MTNFSKFGSGDSKSSWNMILLIREESLAWLFNEQVVTQVTTYPTRYKKTGPFISNKHLRYVKLDIIGGESRSQKRNTGSLSVDSKASSLRPFMN